MPDKIPLFGKNDEQHHKQPPARPPVPPPSPRRHRSKFEIERDRRRFKETMIGYARILLVIAIFVGAYYAYRYFTDPEYLRNGRFALMEKFIIDPVKYKHPSKQTHLGGKESVIYPPKYIFKCLGEKTRDNYFVVVDETIYYDYPLRTIFIRSEIERYEVYNSLQDLKEHYQGIEVEPTDEREKKGFWAGLLTTIRDSITGPEGSEK